MNPASMELPEYVRIAGPFNAFGFTVGSEYEVIGWRGTAPVVYDDNRECWPLAPKGYAGSARSPTWEPCEAPPRWAYTRGTHVRLAMLEALSEHRTLKAEIVSLKVQTTRLEVEREEARACACAALPYVEREMDVVDGSDGVPVPNDAMRLAQRIGDLL